MIRQKTNKVIIDINSNFAIYIKAQNVLPQYMAYQHMKNKFEVDGKIFVPEHLLMSDGEKYFLLIEGVINFEEDGFVWYFLDSKSDLIYSLAENLVYLIRKLEKSDVIREKIDYRRELNEITNIHPTGVDISKYKSIIEMTEISCEDNKVRNKFLIPRDIYNNILIGFPWSNRKRCTSNIPLSIIDFGEVYKYTTSTELVGEIFATWTIKHNNSNETIVLIKTMVSLLMKNNLWDDKEVTFFYFLWKIRLLIWENNENFRYLKKLNNYLELSLKCNYSFLELIDIEMSLSER